MSPVVRLAITALAMVGFFLPFFIFTERKSEKAVVTVSAARWGILLQSLGFLAIYLHTPCSGTAPSKHGASPRV